MNNEQVVCPRCKKENERDHNFCFECGEPLTAAANAFVHEKKVGAQIAIIEKMVPYVKDKNTLDLFKAVILKLTKK